MSSEREVSQSRWHYGLLNNDNVVSPLAIFSTAHAIAFVHVTVHIWTKAGEFFPETELQGLSLKLVWAVWVLSTISSAIVTKKAKVVRQQAL